MDGVESETGFAGIVGRHPSMRAIFDVMRKVAPTDTTVLITGESGTGKELVAAAIHRLSRRAAGRFVAVHCGAIPEDLLESEMFGHERGAFTGAIASRVGRFKLADGGTIFLDEIGEMSPKLQVKLLRVLEDGRFEPVGSVVTHQVDVRIIAATNRSLEAAVAARQFREDLFYRLRVVPIEMPPLRRRRDDVPDLPPHLLAPPPLGEAVPAMPWQFGPAGIDFYHEMEAIEDRIIAQALRLSGGNKKEAARLLRVNRTTLLEKLKRKRAQGSPLAALLGGGRVPVLPLGAAADAAPPLELAPPRPAPGTAAA